MGTLKKLLPVTALPLFSVASLAATDLAELTYPVVDTHVSECTNTTAITSQCPEAGDIGYGQDAQYAGLQPNYIVHDNGTVSDVTTGLVWARTTDINKDGAINAADKLTYSEATAYAAKSTLGGFDDWRVPTIKELYSLILFDGQDPSGMDNKPGSLTVVPFIDNRIFGFNSGDMQAGERLIDAQFVSATKYVSTTMTNKQQTVFGVNFIDGRIKGYGLGNPAGEKTFYLLLVRGEGYGKNNFVNNKNQTITDLATGLTWQQADSIKTMNWPSALNYCETLELAGRDDWRLPNAKELQSIVDYNRSPDTTHSAAIDPLFISTEITNEAGKRDYANYWSSTTHLNPRNAANAVYVAFGRSLGFMNGQWVDVHGAGSQRSDPKVDNGINYSQGHGPQGDSVRINNLVRCVTDDYTKLIPQPSAVTRTGVTFNITADSDKKPPAERPATATGKPMQGNPIERLDSNKDGYLSKAEARGPIVKAFDQIDLNADGLISEEEFMQSRSHHKAGI